MLREYIEKYCVNLNIAKMICAFGVLFCHAFAISANQMDYLEKWSNGQTNIGGISVAFFFFISGLYASRSLYSRMNVRDFLQRRFWRMFPQLWVVVFLCVFMLGVGLTSLPLKRYFSTPKTYLYFLNAFAMPYHDLPGVFVNQYYTTVNGSLWTIPIELLSYIGISSCFSLGWALERGRTEESNCDISCYWNKYFYELDDSTYVYRAGRYIASGY